MKTLFIGTSCPYGEINGMGLRTRHIVQILEQLGDVKFVSISNRWTESQIEETLKYFPDHEHFEPSPKKRGIYQKLKTGLLPRELETHPVQLTTAQLSRLQELINQHDLIWIHTIKIANLLKQFRIRNSILDADDFPSQYCLTIVKNSKSLSTKANNIRLYAGWKLKEETSPERFSGVVVCKPSDQNNFAIPERTLVLPNGFDTPSSQYSRIPEPQRFGMIGNFDYQLNQDAIEWFISQSWSLIKSKLPAAKLILIGKSSERYSIPENGVEGMGYLPDVETEMSSWSALLAPTRYGGGTSVKIAEAFSKKIPVIASSHGARGYAVRNGIEILVADSGNKFAEHCLDIARNPTQAKNIGEAAFSYFEKKLSWKAQSKKLHSFVTDCLQHTPTSLV